jgi:hypothetical protein
MDYAPTLKALAEKRFELDLEGETIGKLKAAMQEQLHRLQIEERQLVKQLEGDPAAGTEWMLRTVGGSAQRQHTSSTAAVAPGQQPAGIGATAAVATPEAGQSASRRGCRNRSPFAAAAAAAGVVAADNDDDDDDDMDNMDDMDDDDTDGDMDDDADEESRQRLRAELMKLMNSR